MAQVKWTKNAIEDIYNVMEYLRHYSDKYAEAFADKIFERAVVYVTVNEERVDILTVHPSALPFGEDFLDAGYK